MVVLVIISLLAAMAAASVRRIQASSRAKAVANDLRVFAGALQTYNSQNNAWPAEQAAGVYPPELASAVKSADWTRLTPFGGSYNWDNAQTHAGTKYTAAIAISSVVGRPITATAGTIQMLDKLIDDGNTATGNFFLGAAGEPVFIIQK